MHCLCIERRNKGIGHKNIFEKNLMSTFQNVFKAPETLKVEWNAVGLGQVFVKYVRRESAVAELALDLLHRPALDADGHGKGHAVHGRKRVGNLRAVAEAVGRHDFVRILGHLNAGKRLCRRHI
jgi:hypothetical protein